MRKSLLAKGLIEPTALPDRTTNWMVDGGRVSYRITSLALAALGIEPEEMPAEVPTVAAGESEAFQALDQPTMAEPTPAAFLVRPGASLREAAQAVLAAWDEPGQPILAATIDALRTRLAPPARSTRVPRTGTKQEAVLNMLRRPEGATVAQIAEAMAWQPHTVRGFLVGLKRKGITITVLERVRQVGPNKEGAKGSYSIYRLVEAG